MTPVDNPLEVFFDLVPTGAVLYAPVRDTAGEVIDFRFVRLNPAAQRLLGLPAQPTKTFCEYYPHSVPTGIFARYRQAYLTGQAATYDVPYAGDGLDTFFQLVAQRSGELLVVNFTDMADLPRSAVEATLREAKAAEQAARAEVETQRQRLTEILRHLPAQVAAYHGPDHVYTFVNPRYQAYFPDQGLLGYPVREATPAAAGQGFFDRLDRVYQTGESYCGVELPVNLDFSAAGRGQQVFINTCYHPLYDSQGQIEGVLDFSYDVTEQVRARQLVQQLNQDLEIRIADATQIALALQADMLAAAQRQVQERETFYQIFAQTPAAISIQRGPAHHYAYVNQTYQDFFPGRLLLGQPMAAVLPAAVATGVVALLDHVYQTGETCQQEELPLLLTQPASAPKQRYFTFTYQALRENGEVVGVSTFAQEVTAQVLARRTIEQQQQQLHALFEQALVAIAIYRGPRYIIELANPAMCAIGERTQAQAIGTPLFELLPETAGQGFEQLLDGVITTGIPYVAHELPSTIERAGRRDLVYWNFVYQPLRDAQGHTTGVMAVATEVSEQVRARQLVQHLNQELQVANEALQKSNQQLTRTNVDLDNFIYAASHDLKAPIANIEGLLLLLRKQLPAAAQQAGMVPRVLGLMQDSIDRFRLTIAQLTDLTRLQQVQQEPAQAVALAAVVEAVRLDLAPLLEATGAELTVDVSAYATVRFAPPHLRSLLYNLLSNAVKYRHPDRVPQVTLRCREAANATVLEVEDNGLGLSEQQQGKLFRLFQRLHGHVEGSGVGLYLVKRIVENAGGTITVHSELGQGTTFTVTFSTS
ncbi:MAG: PAS domain-containing protein [Janthinobacterium lividum]